MWSTKSIILLAIGIAVCGAILFENYVNFGVRGLIVSLLAMLIVILAAVDWQKVTDRIFY